MKKYGAIFSHCILRKQQKIKVSDKFLDESRILLKNYFVKQKKNDRLAPTIIQIYFLFGGLAEKPLPLVQFE